MSDDKPRRFTVSMTTGLVAAFGAVVATAVVVVLLLSLEAGRRNVFGLLSGQAELVSLYLNQRIAAALSPTKRAVDRFAEDLAAGRVAREDESLRQYMRAVLPSVRNMSSLLFVDETRAFVAFRPADRVLVQELPREELPAMMRRAGFTDSAIGPVAKQARWGQVFRQDRGVAILGVRRDLPGGYVAAGIRMRDLSRDLAEAAELIEGTTFALYRHDFVLAHSRLAGTKTDGERALPHVNDFDDEVLRLFRAGSVDKAAFNRFSEESGIHIVLTEDYRDFPLIIQPVAGLGDLPVEVGVYFDGDRGDEVFRRLIGAAIAGLAVLVVALIVAYVLARGLAQPIRALGAAADRIRRLELDSVEILPATRVREIEFANRAFAGMAAALGWFQSYVPRPLADRLIRQAELPASKVREITVMFTDIAGFSGIAERLDADRTAAFLNEHFALLGTRIEAEDGIIDKYVGDSVMAFWGAPAEQPDHAARACRAALAIRDALITQNREREAAGQPAIRLRIGLQTGSALVGNIGAPGRINYTVVGDTVNQASRLEAYGKRVAPADCVIICGDRTINLAGDGFNAHNLGPTDIPGLQAPITVWVLGEE